MKICTWEIFCCRTTGCFCSTLMPCGRAGSRIARSAPAGSQCQAICNQLGYRPRLGRDRRGRNSAGIQFCQRNALAALRPERDAQQSVFWKILTSGLERHLLQTHQIRPSLVVRSRLEIDGEEWSREWPILFQKIQNDQLPVIKRSKSGDVLRAKSPLPASCSMSLSSDPGVDIGIAM